MIVRILVGDVLARLADLPNESVHCVVTSPPYWGLRDYGEEGQLGLEATPDEYLARMVEVFREVRRVLRSDGTLWLNMGDSYAGNGGGEQGPTGQRASRAFTGGMPGSRGGPSLKPKDLVLMPARLALALQADGWWVRSEIIWAKPSCMPESVTDRPTRAHETVYLLAKERRYFYDAEAVREADAGSDHPRHVLHRPEPSGGLMPPHNGIRTAGGRQGNGRNLRTVWTISPQPFPEAHFATFPEALPERCVKAGTSLHGVCPECGAPWERVVDREPSRPGVGGGSGWAGREAGAVNAGTQRRFVRGGGFGGGSSETTGWRPTCDHDGDPVPATVLDPFGGAGTTGLVAAKLGRDAVLIELSPEYAAMAEKRIRERMGLLAAVDVLSPLMPRA